MQTLKTGAIIVLLMTVVFSAYSSLTTPPDELAEELDQMVIFDDEGGNLDLETGLPPSFAEMDFDTGEPASAGEMLAGDPVTSPSGPADVGVTGTTSMNFGGTNNGLEAAGNSSLAGSPNATLGSPTTNGGPNDTAPSGIDIAFSDSGTNASTVSTRINEDNPTNLPESYPQTDNSFALPNPGDAIAGLTNNGEFSSAPRSNEMATTSSTDDATMEARRRDMGFENAIRTADEQYEQDRRKDALATLSLFYRTPNLTSQQREQLLARLDHLAAAVIYLREHLLETPYRVKGKETLMQVADQYQVSWQLLANMNGVKDPYAMLPGTDLKVVRGPFRAEVDLSDQELTLFLGEYYAGRFSIATGDLPRPVPGQYTVQAKQPGKAYYSPQGTTIEADDASNPYGGVWMDLGGQMCLHGSSSRTRANQQGCISLPNAQAKDLYAILSVGSSVTIRP